ncbi:MAG TPA: signal peptidase II [bacterium]|nr:signal peptidase II [bacterium]HQC50889.1 signal peptidase II [bacterium]HQG13912.1 signal peptidase II [bacterium]HQH80092.1 signal peptidase II [bacterium]
MKKKYILFSTIVSVLVMLDQITKWLVAGNLFYGERIPVIGGIFDLVHFRNTGAAFGIFSGLAEAIRNPIFFTIAAFAAVMIILYLRSLRDDDTYMTITLSLIFGGMVGNIIDRAARGSVVDFLSFRAGDAHVSFSLLGRSFDFPLEWPAFNVADSAITVAMFMLIIMIFRKGGNPT